MGVSKRKKMIDSINFDMKLPICSGNFSFEGRFRTGRS
jgi:hypothetical protein